jgi:serine/threonine-protein kinase
MPDSHDTIITGGGGGDDDRGAEAYCAACNQSFPPEMTICPDDGSRLVRFEAQHDPLIGRVLDDRYEVRAALGSGGMGTVYRAWQRSVDREVAVKVVHPKLSSDRQVAKRFLREVRLASKLGQPNIVNVYDFGQTPDNVLYLVMELLRGHTLGAELDGQRRFTVKRTSAIALQLCDALEAAHAQGIIHRDLKPNNIILLDDPPGRDLLKVLDFGLAKSLATDTTSEVTNTDAILGTPLYMSPEAVQGKPTDQRSDLYSLGCILYQLLAGTPPFVDESVNLVLARHLSDHPPPLPPHVPAGIRATIERLLAKHPDHRIQTAAEVRAAIQSVLDGGSGQVFDLPADTVPDLSQSGVASTSRAAFAATLDPRHTPVPGTAVPSAPISATEVARRSRALPLAFAFAGAIGAGVLAFVALRPDEAARVVTTIADAAPAEPAIVVDATVAPPVDAALRAVDAAPPPADARKRDRDRDRDRDRGRGRKKTRDAATDDPQIDFLPSGPKK